MAKKQYNKYSNSQVLKRLWVDYISKQLPKILAAVGLMIIVAAAASSQPLLLEVIFDKVLDTKDSPYINIIPFAIIGIFLVQGITGYFATILMSSAGFKVAEEMQNKLFSHLINHDLVLFSENKSGELMSRMTNEIIQLQEVVSSFIVVFFKQGFTFIGLSAVMFYQSWQLTLICLGVYVFAIYPVLKITRRLKKLGRDGYVQAAGLLAHMSESFYGIKTVKAYGKEVAEHSRASVIMKQYFRLKFKGIRTSGLSSPILELLAGTSIALVIWSVASGTLSSINTKGELLSFIAALIIATKPIKALNGLNNALQIAMAGAERYYTMLDSKAKIVDLPKAKQLKITLGEVEFKAVNFSYGNDLATINDLSLKIPAGKKVALVGHSGSGKSTLVNLLLRFYDVDSGAIEIDGQDIRKCKLKSLRENISLVSQEVFLFSDSIADNIAYGKENATRVEIVEAAKKAEAHEFISAQHKGYDTNCGESGKALSGGQRQRIAIARAFLKDAPILVLDEATSSLDPIAEREIQNTLEGLMKNKTTLIIAHRLSTVQNADLIYVLDSGRVIEKGTHKQLMKNSKKYAELFSL
jgi:subfamily B ATP-binding cassette protein MsbA